MIFGKHINRYYLRYLPLLILGLLALLIVDYMQLVIPELYRNVINGIKTGSVTVDDVLHSVSPETVDAFFANEILAKV